MPTRLPTVPSVLLPYHMSPTTQCGCFVYNSCQFDQDLYHHVYLLFGTHPVRLVGSSKWYPNGAPTTPPPPSPPPPTPLYKRQKSKKTIFLSALSGPIFLILGVASLIAPYFGRSHSIPHFCTGREHISRKIA